MNIYTPGVLLWGGDEGFSCFGPMAPPVTEVLGGHEKARGRVITSLPWQQGGSAF